MKKIVVFVLVMLLAVVLSACGKPEEEQVQNEIYEHMKEEAAADGVDLDALIASEQAAYQESHEEYLDERAAAQEFRSKVDPMLDELETAYAAYKAATGSEDIISTAEAFNALYGEYMALAEQEPDSEQKLLTQLQQRIRRRTEIAECIYRIKAAYADFADKESFLEAWCYYDLEENNAYIAMVGEKDICILRTDGSVCNLDLSTVVTDTTAFISPIGVADSMFLLYTIDNADYLYFEFPLDGDVAAGSRTERRAGDYEQWWFNNNLEDFVLEEMRVYWK